MKIRHVVLTNAFAGVERHVCVLANQQARMGNAVEVWGGNECAMRAHLDPAVRHRRAVSVVGVTSRSLAVGRPEVLHAHMTRAEAAAVLTAMVRGTPLVVTRHFGAARGRGLKGSLARRIITPQLDAQIAVSEYVARMVEGMSTVVYPGVEAPRTTSRKRRPVVLVVQRLQPEKNTALAVRAFAAAAPPGWTLEVVGRGRELDALRQLAGQLRIGERTRFLGFRNDVSELMRSSSVLLAPCEVEGLGLSVLEAMGQGLPVLASNSGAHPETVGRTVDARLFKPGDAHHAAMLLADLCADGELRQRYGNQLRETQQACFTPEAQALGTEAVYRRVLS